MLWWNESQFAFKFLPYPNVTLESRFFCDQAIEPIASAGQVFLRHIAAVSQHRFR